MISDGDLRCDSLKGWLTGDLQTNGSYRHMLLRESSAGRAKAIDELRIIFAKVHRDAKGHLASLVAEDLDPLPAESAKPWGGYPSELNSTTKQGYLGEVLAAILSENYAPFGETGWRVPVIPFRFHLTALQAIERSWQGSPSGRMIPGRTGDDCLAFVLTPAGEVAKILFVESKCCLHHQVLHVRKAHRQVGSAMADLPRIIEILKDYVQSDAMAKRWRTAIQRLWLRGQTAEPVRYNLVVYVCGKSPKKPPNRVSWMNRTIVSSAYESQSPLEAIELHLSDVSALIEAIYANLVVQTN